MFRFFSLVIATLDAFHFDLRDLKQHLESTSTIAVTEETLDQKKSKNSKQQIFAFVNGKILPKLRELLRPKTQFNSHKRAQNFTSNIFQYEDEKLLRAPLVLATARLFKWLPQRVVDQNMNGCLLTLNHLLMSRSISVRQGARKLMINLVKIVGPLQFPHIIRELKQTMNKGYQIHVMIFTVHALISAIAEDLKPGDLDSCLRELLEICKWEAFGNDQFEESFNKDGQTLQLRSESHGVPEAKTSNNKTSETLTQIGRFIGSEKALNEIVLEHIREIVEASPKAETIRKLSEWLRALSAGLRINAGGIPPLQQLNFSLTLARKSMRHMEEDKQRLNNSQHLAADKSSLRPPNCLLLPTEPKRLGVIHRIAIKSKMHIFVEFAFQILVDQLKGRSVNVETENENLIEEENSLVLNDNPTQAKEFIPLLEQFVPLLLEALNKKYDKITALSLRSIFYLFKWPLESLNSRLSKLFDLLFVVLNDYASLGQSGNRPTIIELHLNLF
uniref:U3 small nucleolar RNA-associated protein 20 C-terminal domain-containing protein n=1 Tax=Meloidogyne incognita TaxID=6306 RepID=A0A914NPT3_MELIC